MGIESIASKNQTYRALKAKVAPRLGALLAILLAVSVVAITAGCAGLTSGQTLSSKQGLSLSFTPSSLNFGSVPTGKKTSVTATVTNTSSSSATITQIVSSSNQFTISGITYPLTLTPGQTASFLVWFNGSAPGKTAGTLTFQSPSASAEIPVSATDATPQPQLTVSPANLDAGSATVGSKTTSNITLSNVGTADLTISVLTIAGAPFNVTGIATPKVISAGQSTVMGVTFAPTATGADSGSVSIVSNDPASPATIGLSGTGTSAPVGHLTVNPSTLTFGSVLVGSNTAQVATVTNTGQAAVHISQVLASGSGFSETGLATPATLAVGQSAQLPVIFAPTATGIAGGTVGITSDAPGAAPGLALSGTGVQPGISVSPASISFGSLVDGQSKSQPVTITNTGTASLTVTQLGSSASGVSVNGVANQSVTITNTGNSSTTVSQVGVSGQGLAVSGVSTPLALTPGQGA